MPLVRVAVRNEFGLGQLELCSEANKEDPKAVLDAVAVSGLVGILRQLGDLAEFAAEVFHDLQEQVMTTASRSHKLIVRVQHIDTALSPLERAILAQTSHIHFAYTAGSEWHAHIKNGQNHFIYNDLPRFIMDSYEECRDPPRLHLLDKFDPGGPGSCLKRYSDPTFFKRVSAHSNEAYAEKVQKDKKTHIKNKKKKTSKRNGELLRGASVSNHSRRMQFISNERTSSSQTASTVDTILKSDLGDHSNSFDSKNGSGYIECVFDMGSSMQPEEQESKELSSSRLTQLELDDMFELVSPGEQTGFQDDNFSHSSSQEKIAPSPSCAAWDEKTEIEDPKGQECDGDEDIGRFPSNPELDSQDVGIAELQNVDQMEILFGDENTLTSISRSYEVHEIESEPDNYVDALNTIESESENDLDCQTKREVEQNPSSVKNEGMVYGMHEFTEHNSNPHASDSESHTASDIYPNKGIPLDLPNSVPSESFIAEHTPQIAGKSSYSDHSPGTDLCGSAGFLDGSKLESIINDPSSSCLRISGSQDQSGDKIIHSFDHSQESLTAFSGCHSVQFWTNGGLLGLEPSKPPVFTVSNDATHDSVRRNKNQTVVPLNHTLILNGDGHKVQLDMLENTEITKSTLCSTSCHDKKDGNTEKTSWGLSQADDKFENSGNSHLSTINQTSGVALNEIRAMAPESALSTAPDVKTTTTHSGKENDENSPQIFGLSHRLLLNGFRRKMSLVRDDKSELATSMTTGVLEPKSELHGVAYQKTSETTFKELFGHGSSEDSPSSSPPLEHMKISFHPVNGFEISKLKLKIPNGTQSHESTGDMFSSFQLVPEPAITLHDIDSDSDDDTFCRSSPYTLDDCLSDHSESNSEQWESGEILGSKDHEIYDAIGRITLVESTSSSLELGGVAGNGICSEGGLKRVFSETGVKHSSPNGHLVDLPNFDDVNCVLQGDIKYDSNPKSLLELHYPRELATPPPPPPLPPVEWRVSKTRLDLAEEKQNVSEAFKHAFDLKILQSTVSQQPKTAPNEQQQTNEEDIAFKPKSKQPDQHLLSGEKVADQAANGKEMGEREHFLQQIRTKSFNLRRTATARPTITQVPTASVKVTAILEKANAIRQAVGSDDGEDDDNWSNT